MLWRGTMLCMKAVIFDFDGTIVDSLPGVIKVLEKFTRRRVVLHEKDLAEFRQKSLLQLARTMRVAQWKWPILALFGRRMFRHHLRSVRVHEGLPELIAKLSRKIPLYVLSTNRQENIAKYLKWHGLDRYFDGIYGSANVLSKTYKMRQLLDRERIRPEDVWCVGDEVIDVKSAQKVGMSVVAVTWGYASRSGLAAHHPEHMVDTAEELSALLLNKLET